MFLVDGQLVPAQLVLLSMRGHVGGALSLSMHAVPTPCFCWDSIPQVDQDGVVQGESCMLLHAQLPTFLPPGFGACTSLTCTAVAGDAASSSHSTLAAGGRADVCM